MWCLQTVKTVLSYPREAFTITGIPRDITRVTVIGTFAQYRSTLMLARSLYLGLFPYCKYYL
jgi:hypothetical protein